MAIIFNPFDGQLAPHPDYSAEFAKLDSLYFLPTPTKTGPSTYAANIGEEVRCNTITTGSFTVTLPVASDGDSIKIVDVIGVSATTGFGANNLIVETENTATIMGDSDLVINVGATKLVLMYNNSDTDWKIVDIDSPQFTNLEWSSILDRPTYGTTSSIELNLTGTPDNYVVEGDLVNNGVELNHLSTEVQNSLASAVKITGDQVIDGNKTFNGPFLILPNNSRVNGVEHFYQTTKPTARGDSSALVVGDRWWKTDDGTEWFWNGTYWTGIPESARHVLNGPNWISTPTSDTRFSMMLQHRAIMDSVELVLYSNAYFQNIDASNHFVLNISYTQNVGGWLNFSSIPTYNTFTGVGDLYSRTYAGQTAIGNRHIIIPIGQVVAFNSSSSYPTFRGIRVSATQVGTPGGGAFLLSECVLNYRRIL